MPIDLGRHEVPTSQPADHPELALAAIDPGLGLRSVSSDSAGRSAPAVFRERSSFARPTGLEMGVSEATLRLTY